MAAQDDAVDFQRRRILRDSFAMAATAGTGLLAGAAGTSGAQRAQRAASPLRAASPALTTGALVSDTYNRYRWAPPQQPFSWNVLESLRASGMEWLRMWTTTLSYPQLRTTGEWYQFPWQNGFWSCLELSGALLQAGAAQGFRLQAILFLSDRTGSAGGQPLAAEWVGLTPDQLAVKVRESSATTAAYYKSLGLNVEVWEIGNETDFGLCGIQLGETAKVPPGIDWTTDTGWMHDALWSKMAVLMKAAIEGIHSVYPDAKMLLHIAGFGYSPGNVLTSGFFKSMIDSGVPYDIAGLSYPYLVVPSPVLPQPYFAQAEFQNALTAIGALGKRVQVVEFNYPNSPSAVVQAQNASPRYPLTPQGQADFIRDFAAAVTGKVESLFYWYPDYYTGFSEGTVPELDSCGLYSANGIPQPALATFRAIADGAVASRNNCLFDWAERNYPQFFYPPGASTAVSGPYTFRRYAGSGNYVGVSSADNSVYVLGPNFGPEPVKLGPATNFLAMSSCS